MTFLHRDKSRSECRGLGFLFAFLLLNCLIFPATTMAGDADLEKIEVLIGSGHFSQALTQIKPLLEQQPGHVSGRFLQAQALFAVGKQKQAQQLMQDLLREQPRQPEIHNNLAVMYASQGNYDGARKQLELALATHSGYQVAYDNLTVIYNRLASQTYHNALSPDEKLVLPEPHLAMIAHLLLPAIKQDVPVSENTRPVTTVPVLTDDKMAIKAMIKSWARAWSSQKPEQYLGHYDDHFTPRAGLSKKEWVAKRRVRLKKPQYIRVNVDNIDIIPIDERVVSVFLRQHYESDRLNDTVSKNLIIRKGDDKWRIFQESLVR